ncbi:MAG: hypothetical protein ACRDZ2_16530, partial [Ilumatobacteraceae bacterium]
PLIKVMNLVSLLMLPAIISLEIDESAWRFAVAGAALIVLIGAIVYSSRPTQGLAAGTVPHQPPASTTPEPAGTVTTPFAGE